MYIALVALAAGFLSPPGALATTPVRWPHMSTISPPTPRIFNVTDYGALGDGVTDDVGHVKQAVAAAVEAGGGTVYLPTGTYLLYANERIDDPDNAMQVNLKLEDGVTFKGDGIGRTILTMAGPSYASGFGSIRGTDVHIKDLSITTDHATHNRDGDGIKLEGVTDSSFAHVFAENQYIAYAVIGCQDVTFRGCVAKATSLNFSVSVADAFPDCSDILLDRCESSDSEQCGFWAYHDDGSASTRVKTVTFRYCLAHDNRGAGFYSKWSDRCTWDGCTSTKNAWGFYLIHAKNYVVTHCKARRNTASGFRCILSSARRRQGVASG